MDTNNFVKLLPPDYEQACFEKKQSQENEQLKILWIYYG